MTDCDALVRAEQAIARMLPSTYTEEIERQPVVAIENSLASTTMSSTAERT